MISQTNLKSIASQWPNVFRKFIRCLQFPKKLLLRSKLILYFIPLIACTRFTFVLQMSNVQVSVATDEGFHESTHDTEPLVRGVS